MAVSEIVEVKVVTEHDSYGSARETLIIDGNEVMYVGPLWECPEDATLERDLVGPSTFASLLERFLKEHKGKKVRFVYEDEEEEE
jgi:hypothetical protein